MFDVLWIPSKIEIGEVGYITDEGRFEKKCNIWDLEVSDLRRNHPDIDGKRIVRMLHERLDKRELQNEKVWVEEKRSDNVGKDRDGSLPLRRSKRKERQLQDLKLNNVPDAKLRYRNAIHTQIKGQYMSSFRDWWETHRGVFEDMYRVDLKSDHYRVTELLLGILPLLILLNLRLLTLSPSDVDFQS